jgi:hypothetical protein
MKSLVMTANKTIASFTRQQQMKDRNITASPQRAQELDAAKKQEYTSVNIIFETAPTGRAKFQPGAESKTDDQIAAWEC